jgi:hypothetical protein
LIYHLPPSTSSATQFETVTVASARKIHFFKGKKRQESSDSDSEPGPSQKAMRLEEEEEDVEENVASADLNFIIDLSCLQSLVTMSGVLCPQCKMPVSLFVCVPLSLSLLLLSLNFILSLSQC